MSRWKMNKLGFLNFWLYDQEEFPIYDGQTELFYSGDFDGKGLSIAAQLCGRYPELLRLWHMVPGDYALCRSNVPLSEPSRSLLQGCAGTALEASAEAVKQCDRAGYQELLIPLLETDLTETL